MEEAWTLKNNVVSLGIAFPGLTWLWKGACLSPEAMGLAEQSRDPGILTHSCVLRDTFSPVSPAMDASFCGFSLKPFLRGALPAKSGLERITVLALLILY